MARPIRWLHISDLHYGCPGKELWEQVEQEFFRDVDAMLERVGGPPDLLLFTGDLAYSGAASEYEEVDRFLDELLAHLRKGGAADPILVAVPGNHDVAWPSRNATRAFHVLRSFDGTTDDPDVAGIYNDLWKKRDASLINELFPGYRPWFERRVRPQLEAHATSAHFSQFPCDFTAVVEPEGAFPLTLVGLDSTWLQYTSGDFDGKLLIPIEQLRAALAPPSERKPYAKVDGQPALLLMHQPPDWQCERGRELFDSSIYPPSRLTACLFGHRHRSTSRLFHSGGGQPRVYMQALSLFGLEHWGTNKEERAFGYSWGHIAPDGEIRLCLAVQSSARTEVGASGMTATITRILPVSSCGTGRRTTMRW